MSRRSFLFPVLADVVGLCLRGGKFPSTVMKSRFPLLSADVRSASPVSIVAASTSDWNAAVEELDAATPALSAVLVAVMMESSLDPVWSFGGLLEIAGRPDSNSHLVSSSLWMRPLTCLPCFPETLSLLDLFVDVVFLCVLFLPLALPWWLVAAAVVDVVSPSGARVEAAFARLSDSKTGLFDFLLFNSNRFLLQPVERLGFLGEEFEDINSLANIVWAEFEQPRRISGLGCRSLRRLLFPTQSLPRDSGTLSRLSPP